MKTYILIYKWEQGYGEYEGCVTETSILGVFSTREKAFEKAKKHIKDIHNTFHDSIKEEFLITEDGHSECSMTDRDDEYAETYSCFVEEFEIDKEEAKS